jgi:drug/metabolite transporter (DMT)-like permease
VLGVFLALSGAFLIVALGETGLPNVNQANPIGYLMIFSAALFSGFTTIYVRKNMVQYQAFEVTSLRLFFAALFVLPLSFILDGFDLSRATTTGYVVVVFAALTLFAGFFLGFYVIQRFGVTVAAMSDYVPPIVASLGGAFLLGEKVTTGMLAGMVLILTGVAVINLKRRRHRKQPYPQIQPELTDGDG